MVSRFQKLKLCNNFKDQYEEATWPALVYKIRIVLFDTNIRFELELCTVLVHPWISLLYLGNNNHYIVEM